MSSGITNLGELEEMDLLTDGYGQDLICVGITEQFVFLCPYIESTLDGDHVIEVDMGSIKAFDREMVAEDSVFKPVESLYVGYDEE